VLFPVCYDVRLSYLNKEYLLTYLLGLMQKMKLPSVLTLALTYMTFEPQINRLLHSVEDYFCVM